MDINQIRPSHLDELAKQAYSKDVLFYKSKLTSFTQRDCPGCGTSKADPFTDKDGFHYSRCLACHCIYMNPGPTEVLLEEFYKTSENYKFWAEFMYPESRIERLKTIHRDRADWISSFLSEKINGEESVSILELGAGTGDTLTTLINSNSTKICAYAIEPNPSMEPHLLSNGIRVISPVQLSEKGFLEKFDAIICFEVLEHLLEPSKTLKEMAVNLKKGGYFFASTPNAQSIEVQILKERSSTLDIEHITILTPASINALAAQGNYKVIEIKTPGSLDLELIKRGEGNFCLTQGGHVVSGQSTQGFISDSGLSSHMKLILMRN